MNEEFILAGKITARVREESKKWVTKGAKYTFIADKIENRIRELGAKPAFPVNISVNDRAAHDTARPEDERELKVGDVVKIDLGAQVNGYVGDSAYTVEIETEKHKELINASLDALNNALKITKKGTELREIGRIIETTITKTGYNPIRNLGGHPLSQGELHGDFIIPNYDNNSTQKISEGTYAIEPFATNGEGWVTNDNETLIYNLETKRPTRNPIARDILKHVTKYYATLPFAERWIAKEIKHYEYGLKNLIQEGIIHAYHVLKEQSKGIVAQSEHSILINDKTTITTN